MSMCGPSGGDAEEAPLFTEINVTPLTDIFLVLLIIFMVTASGLTTASIDVALPRAAPPGSLDAASVVTVSVDARNRFFLGKDEVAPERLEAAIHAALEKARDPSVVLAGDKGTALDRVVTLMEAARKAGAKRFAIAVAREEGRGETAMGAAGER